MSVSTIGVDLAKSSFSIYAVDSSGKPLIRRTVTRAKLLETLAQIPLGVVGLEACSGAQLSGSPRS